MSFRNYNRPRFDYDLTLSHKDLLLVFDGFSLFELSGARDACARFRYIADNIVRIKYRRIDFSDYLRDYYGDRVRIFEAFGSLFEKITIRYPKDNQLHLKLVRDHSRKTVKSLRLITADLLFVNDEWTVQFNGLEKLIIRDCEARIENLTQLLSLCPNLKRFELIWTITSAPVVGEETRNCSEEPILYHQHEETGGSAADKLKEFLNRHQKTERFHLYLPKANANIERHQHMFVWKVDTDSKRSEKGHGTN